MDEGDEAEDRGEDVAHKGGYDGGKGGREAVTLRRNVSILKSKHFKPFRGFLFMWGGGLAGLLTSNLSRLRARCRERRSLRSCPRSA